MNHGSEGSPDDGGPAEDRDALDRLREGEPEALGELMSGYWEPLLAYVTSILGSADASEDVVQETFVNLWKSRTRLAAEGSPRALLYQIARNVALKRVRHRAVRSRKEPQLRQFLERRVRTPMDEALATERRDVLEEAIAALPERRREAFMLVRFEGFSLREAADVMGLSPQTVANHAVLAMKQLRSLLARYQDC